MPSDLTTAYSILGLFTLLLVGILLLALRKSARQKQLLRFWYATGLPMGTDTIAAAAERRITARTVGTLLGTVAGVLVSAVLLVVVPGIASVNAVWFLVLPLILTSQAIGEVAASVSQSLFMQQTDVPRVARPTAVTIHDYVSPVRLVAAPVLIVVAMALGVVAFCFGAAGKIDASVFLRSAALPVLATSLVVIAVGVLLERRVLNEPQPVASELQLAWDDAFRAESFLDIRMFVTLVAWLAASAGAIGMLQGLDAQTGSQWSTGLGSLVFIVGYLPIVIAFSVGYAHSYFRFRLWPEMSGESVSLAIRARQ